MSDTQSVVDNQSILDELLALERAALDRWGQGDPDGYLEINAAEMSYFDPFAERRVDGLRDLTDWYETVRGKIKIDRDEIINPRVQVIGEAAILTFQFDSYGSDGMMHWNCTEVYQRFVDAWRIVHSHWAFAKAPAEPPSPAAQ
jgi:hypothetical protein